MLSSRNIHFVILGIILGSIAGYVFAFYQAHSTSAAPVGAETPGTETTAGEEHPDISDEQMLALFQGAIERNPNNPELMTRYANFLFDLERYAESVEWFQKVIALQPANMEMRTNLATALYNQGKVDEAMAEYQKSLTIDPRHMFTLHNMFVVYVDNKKDFAAAEAILRKMEQIDPAYESLPSLRQRLQEDRARFGR
jgi:tetratricopeptide (TPR) repeat protein